MSATGTATLIPIRPGRFTVVERSTDGLFVRLLALERLPEGGGWELRVAESGERIRLARTKALALGDLRWAGH